MSIEITTTSLITGSSNTDGSGGAENLTVENGHEIDLEQGWVIDKNDQDGRTSHLDDGLTTIEVIDNHSGHGLDDIDISIVNTGEWNDDGLKELSVDSQDAADYLNSQETGDITIENFVDVNLHVADTGTWSGTHYHIEGAKRGTIDFSDTTESSNYLSINAHSNGDHWGNIFEVTGSDQSDYVSIKGDESSEYTEFIVDLGAGDDSFGCFLNAPNSSVDTRFVDGGDGFDTLSVKSDLTDLDMDFVNFEKISFESSNGHITLNEEILENNGTEDAPLVVVYADIDFAGDVENVTATEIDYVDELGLHQDGFYEVTVDYADASYTVITDTVDDSWLA